MPERVLTAQEIDSLLNVFRGSAGALRPDASVASYDVNQPTRVPRDVFDALRIRHEQTARDIRARLRQILAKDGDVVVQSFEQVVFSAWRAQLQNPCCAFVVGCRGLREPAVLVIDHALAFGAVDRLLGGTGESTQAPRDLTSTEAAVLTEVLDPLLEAHAIAWRPFLRMEPRLSRQVSVPHFIREIRADEVVLAVCYSLSGFMGGSQLRFAIPLGDLEAHLQPEPGRPAAPEPAAGAPKELRKNLAGVRVDLRVRLGEAELALGDLLGLEKEDVVVLDRGITEPVELLVEDTAKFRGRVRRRGRRLVFDVGRAVDAAAVRGREAGDAGMAEEEG